jgi:hypothetical protein
MEPVATTGGFHAINDSRAARPGMAERVML